MHPLAGKSDNGSSGTEQRWYTEGIAHSHFSANGLRSTANPTLPGAPVLSILGDSHVAAVQVSDTETMGSKLERRLRSAGRAYNVYQYGWSGAGVADYVFEAGLVTERFAPVRTFLIVTAGDFGPASNAGARLVQKGSRVEAEPLSPSSRPGQPESYGGEGARLLKQSGLLYAAALRFTLDIWPRLNAPAAPNLASDARPVGDTAAITLSLAVRAAARGLRDAYGASLFVIYAPAQPYSVHDRPEPEETALLNACHEANMHCESLRSKMLDALNTRHELSRGFSNSQPGFGHLNATGHTLAAEAMWAQLRDLP